MNPLAVPSRVGGVGGGPDPKEQPMPNPSPQQNTADGEAEGGASCPACPLRVRDLYATAHNAIQAWEAAHVGTTTWERSWDRVRRKLDALQASVEAFEPIIAAHFADPSHSGGNATPDEARAIIEHLSATNPEQREGRFPMMYAGKSKTEPHRSRPRAGRWWVELWLCGRYIGVGW